MQFPVNPETPLPISLHPSTFCIKSSHGFASAIPLSGMVLSRSQDDWPLLIIYFSAHLPQPQWAFTQCSRNWLPTRTPSSVRRTVFLPLVANEMNWFHLLIYLASASLAQKESQGEKGPCVLTLSRCSINAYLWSKRKLP